MTTPYVFVLVTSTTCRHCSNFLTLKWDFLKDRITQDGRCSIVHMDLQGSEYVSTDKYHPGIKQYIRFYPSMVMVPSEDWYSYDKPLVLKTENIYGASDPPVIEVENIWNWMLSLLNTSNPIIEKPSARRFTYKEPSKISRYPEYEVL